MSSLTPPSLIGQILASPVVQFLGSTSGPDVTDAELEHLKNLTQLSELELIDTRITDAGLDRLKGLTKLEKLNMIGATKLTDAGLKHLKELTNLRTLILSGINITDAGMEHLKGLTRLEDLILDQTKVTKDGEAKLQQALPHVKVSRGRPPAPCE
jgi:Leucine-rich repeat (LRR) protein